MIMRVPPEFARFRPDTPSVSARLLSYGKYYTMAECNSGSEVDPNLMKSNVRQFLAQGANWERAMLRHLESCRDELAVLLGERTIAEPTRGLLNPRRWWSAALNRFATRVSPVERENANLGGHWPLRAFKQGMADHFKVSHQNARGAELRDQTAEAIELATRLADLHQNAAQIAYHKLKALRGEAL
jgi:hypothetical protein